MIEVPPYTWLRKPSLECVWELVTFPRLNSGIENLKSFARERLTGAIDGQRAFKDLKILVKVVKVL